MQHSAARVKPAVIITGGPLQKCLMMVVHIAARQNARAKPRVLSLFYTREPSGRVGHNTHRQREIRDESIPPADERAGEDSTVFCGGNVRRMSGTRCSMGRFVVNFGSVGSQK